MKKLAFEKTMTQFRDVEARKKKIDDRLADIVARYDSLDTNIKRQETDKEKLDAAGITGEKAEAQAKKISDGKAILGKMKTDKDNMQK